MFFGDFPLWSLIALFGFIFLVGVLHNLWIAIVGEQAGLEAGRRNPTIVTLSLAAEALGIKPSLLLEASEVKPARKTLAKKAHR